MNKEQAHALFQALYEQEITVNTENGGEYSGKIYGLVFYLQEGRKVLAIYIIETDTDYERRVYLPLENFVGQSDARSYRFTFSESDNPTYAGRSYTVIGCTIGEDEDLVDLCRRVLQEPGSGH